MKKRLGITTRSIIIGFILSIIHTCWIVYEETALGHTGATANMLLPSVLGILFIILILNGVFKRSLPSWVLNPSEMMVIFSMTTVAATVAGNDLLQILLPNLMYPFYLGAPSAGYDKYFQYIPSWFMPQDKELIKGFYIGSQDFWRFFRPDVLGPWTIPILFWSGFMFVMAFTMYCLGSILRRQWVDREKLTFPIIELPLMMVKENSIGALFANRLLIGGFAVTSLILSMNYLSAIYPSIPNINLNIYNIGAATFTNPPLKGMNPIWISWMPFAIGLCYLMPLDVAFSCWFFYIFIRLASAFATSQGWRDPNAGFSPTQFPFIYHLAQGAWLGMFVVVMRNSKDHLRQVFKSAFSKEKIPGEEKEPLSYRAAVIGALLGFAILVAAMTISGMRLQVALFIFTIYFLAIIVIIRIYSQIAVPVFELSFYRSIDLATNFSGSKALTPQELTLLSDLHWTDRTYRAHVMGHELESVVFAERQGQNMRRMTAIVLAAIVVGIVVGLLTTFQIYYNRGAATANVANMGQVWVGAEAWGRHLGWMNNPKPPQITDIAKIGTSASIVLLLSMARNIWFSFPLHPIGYAFACSYAMEYIWNIVLITWAIKTVVVRYGGLNLYRRSLPLFFGIALGDAVTQFIWALIMTGLGVKGATPYGPPVW
ncbi:MAG: DUF6785 family protein [Armatimonadota bacterium]